MLVEPTRNGPLGASKRSCHLILVQESTFTWLIICTVKQTRVLLVQTEEGMLLIKSSQLVYFCFFPPLSILVFTKKRCWELCGCGLLPAAGLLVKPPHQPGRHSRSKSTQHSQWWEKMPDVFVPVVHRDGSPGWLHTAQQQRDSRDGRAHRLQQKDLIIWKSAWSSTEQHSPELGTAAALHSGSACALPFKTPHILFSGYPEGQYSPSQEAAHLQTRCLLVGQPFSTGRLPLGTILFCVAPRCALAGVVVQFHRSYKEQRYKPLMDTTIRGGKAPLYHCIKSTKLCKQPQERPLHAPKYNFSCAKGLQRQTG